MSSDIYPNLGFDPAPGDLESVRDLAKAVGRVTQGSSTAQTELHKMGTSDGVWAGKSADAFKDTFSEVPPYLKKALDSLDTAQRALASWETQLDGFQARARRLEQEAAEAARRVNSAQTSVDELPSSTSGMSDKEKEKHEKDAKSKKESLDSANSELSAIRSRAHSLHTEHEQAATAIARQVKGAADDAPPEPGWFDEALNAVGDLLEDAWDTITDPNFWKMIGDILADVAMVVGVLALFFSGLGVAAFIIAGLALAFHLAAMAGGADVTWETLAWDAVGVVAGGLSLAGGRLVQSGRALVMAGRELRLSSGVMNALSKVRPGSLLSGLRGIPSGVANSARGLAMAGKGWSFVASGVAIDKSATWAGAALAIGSNMHNGTWDQGRWTDGEFKTGDIPVVGPFMDYFGPVDEDKTVAPGTFPSTFDAPTALTSSGSTFTQHLDPSQMGTAA
ncbi:putative T7SS-secreted protein [Streptomyces sp. NPDC002742]|uniref:putative T7SS-secreted protein n=1 Tax=Streptomyces sp. NPDC002742 TaxID=3364663 RepID=UPI00369DB865